MRIITVILGILLLSVASIDVVSQTTTNGVYRMDMSRDGSRFATSSTAGLTMYDAEFNQLNFRAYATATEYLYVNPLFSPDGTRILVRSEIWDSTTLETVTTLPIDDGSEPQWSPDSQMILVLPREALIYSASDGRLIRELPYWGYWWRAWGFDTTYFVTGGGDTLLFIDATTNGEIARYVFPSETVGGPIWNPDGTRFALFTFKIVEPGTPNSRSTGSGTQAILSSLFIVDIVSGDRIHIEGLPASIGSATWHLDGRQLAGSANSASLFVWDTKNGSLVESYTLPPEKFITMLRYSATGGRLVAGLVDNTVPSNLNNTILHASSIFSQMYLNGAFQIFVPIATAERFAEIAALCNAPTSLTAVAEDASLMAQSEVVQGQALLAQLDALPEDTIPPGCEADLRAIADAIQAQGE